MLGTVPPLPNRPGWGPRGPTGQQRHLFEHRPRLLPDRRRLLRAYSPGKPGQFPRQPALARRPGGSGRDLKWRTWPEQPREQEAPGLAGADAEDDGGRSEGGETKQAEARGIEQGWPGHERLRDDHARRRRDGLHGLFQCRVGAGRTTRWPLTAWRVRPGNRSTWAYSPPFWNGSRPPSPFHSRRRRFAMRHQVVSLPALSCLCAVMPSCCLSPAATTPASRPTGLRWLSAPHRYWRSSPSRQSPSSIINYRLLVYETVRDRFPGLRGGQPVRIGRRDGLLTGMDGIRVASCAGGE